MGFLGGRDPVAPADGHGRESQTFRRVAQQAVVAAGDQVEVAPQYARRVDAAVDLARRARGLPHGDAGLHVGALDVTHEVHPKLGDQAQSEVRSIESSDEKRALLKGWTRRPTCAQAPALTARIVLMASEGLWSNGDIARALGISSPTATKWRNRFAERLLGGEGGSLSRDADGFPGREPVQTSKTYRTPNRREHPTTAHISR